MTVAATVDSENVQNQGVLQKRCFSRKSLHRLFFSQSPAVSAVPTSRNSMAGKVCEKLVRHVVHEDLGGSFSVHPCAVSLYKVEHLLQTARKMVFPRRATLSKTEQILELPSKRKQKVRATAMPGPGWGQAWAGRGPPPSPAHPPPARLRIPHPHPLASRRHRSRPPGAGSGPRDLAKA